MIDTNALRGVIASNGYSQSRLAKELGISSKTFYSKMSKGVFDSDEIQTMIDVLNIQDPVSIFFAKRVTQ